MYRDMAQKVVLKVATWKISGQKSAQLPASWLLADQAHKILNYDSDCETSFPGGDPTSHSKRETFRFSFENMHALFDRWLCQLVRGINSSSCSGGRASRHHSGTRGERGINMGHVR